MEKSPTCFDSVASKQVGDFFWPIQKIWTLRGRGVVPGGAGCPMAHPDFGDQLTLFQPAGGGADYAHLITTGTPGFSDLPTALGLG